MGLKMKLTYYKRNWMRILLIGIFLFIIANGFENLNVTSIFIHSKLGDNSESDLEYYKSLDTSKLDSSKSSIVSLERRVNEEHLPIKIQGDSDFATQAMTEGWLGDGTSANPYIIQDYHFRGPTKEGEGLIDINSTSVYFVISNCTFTDGDVGVQLTMLSNGTLVNNTIYHCNT